MSPPVRRAGAGRRPDGADVTWTVAEGSKGRRWREVVVMHGAVAWALLYETGPDGRFSHLELAAASGLATLHPEPDGSLHGNVVDAAGVRHVAGVPFAAGTALVVAGSTVGGAALAWALGASGEGRPGVVLDPRTLVIAERAIAAGDLVPIDDDGMPRLAGAASWPLEREGSGGAAP